MMQDWNLIMGMALVVAVTPDGTRAITGSGQACEPGNPGRPPCDNTIRIWRLSDGKCLAMLQVG